MSEYDYGNMLEPTDRGNEGKQSNDKEENSDSDDIDMIEQIVADNHANHNANQVNFFILYATSLIYF